MSGVILWEDLFFALIFLKISRQFSYTEKHVPAVRCSCKK